MLNIKKVSLPMLATMTCLVSAGCAKNDAQTQSTGENDSQAQTGVESVSSAQENMEEAVERFPAGRFDLSNWSITLPLDLDGNGVADRIGPAEIQTYSHPDFFYLDENDRMVFTSPNKATTSPNSTNTRSELRYESRGSDNSIAGSSPGNHFALASHEDAGQFASIGGKMEATLQVDQVSQHAGHPQKPPAYSVVIGQIHSLSQDEKTDGFGYGNEPLKISYKKWPDHETGSVFWAYERNLPTGDPNRTDIAYVRVGKQLG